MQQYYRVHVRVVYIFSVSCVMCHVFLQIIVYGGLLNFEHFLINKCENVEIREIEIFKYHSELMGCALSNVLSYVFIRRAYMWYRLCTNHQHS